MAEEEKKKRSPLLSIIIAVLIIGGIVLFTQRDKFSSDKTYFTSFKNVEGLTVASQVSLGGAIIGKVSGVELRDTDVKVTLAIDPEVKIKRGTVATLVAAGLSGGGSTISLTPGLGPTHIPENGKIDGIDNPPLLGEKGRIGNSIKIFKLGLKTMDTVIDDVALLFGAAARQDIRFQLNKLNRQTNEASRTAREARTEGEGFASKISAINNDVAELAVESQGWHADFADAEKQTADLVKSAKGFGEDVKEMQANFKKLGNTLSKFKDTSGTLGKWINDPQPYHTTTKQLDTMRRDAQDVLDHPSAHWFAIFGKNRKAE